MRSFVSAAMVVSLAGVLYASTLLFAAVTPDLAAPAYALILILALLWAGKLFMAETVSWKPSPVHWAVLAFVLYAFCRYLFSPLEFESRRDFIEVGFRHSFISSLRPISIVPANVPFFFGPCCCWH